MGKQITVRPRANQDLDDHFTYIAQSNSEAALKFFDAARLTIAQIARMPAIGVVYPVQSASLQGLRKWHVKGFRQYMIFYFDLPTAVEVVRILYGSQDINSILEREQPS
ncbi:MULTISPECIES: type II toxin-antitoxin system RelE/ParE family toxin [Cyanophyceae]|uniref:Type II toxin-antitoxin system RelE/ParE family toxin n=1 Tax=Leptolyngbya subtilissima DQ-A4 TaxID=2933933 RepID=A0ABV0K9E1_9CYAN|nr:type II toxin-antitoxin system RelE/ParE family toxin [Nodosilinea sp. FACHB-141]MBD2110746.1 type II toxin-antitoxin system RelE/ParE family toxin [Nodosilinea sp. FACHB-141]